MVYYFIVYCVFDLTLSNDSKYYNIVQSLHVDNKLFSLGNILKKQYFSLSSQSLFKGRSRIFLRTVCTTKEWHNWLQLYWKAAGHLSWWRVLPLDPPLVLQNSDSTRESNQGSFFLCRPVWHIKRILSIVRSEWFSGSFLFFCRGVINKQGYQCQGMPKMLSKISQGFH